MAKEAVLYLDNRLSSRATVCEQDKAFVGPIVDEHGLEQGGYKILERLIEFSIKLIINFYFAVNEV